MIMTTLELVLIIILYIVVGLLSVKPILKVMTSGPITRFDIEVTLVLIVLYPVFWIVMAIVAIVFAVREFYSED